MQKLIMHCSKCHQKMKIQKKAAKYRCPHCAEVIKVSSFKVFNLSIGNALQNFRSRMKNKVQNAKNAYRYAKMLRQNKKK